MTHGRFLLITEFTTNTVLVMQRTVINKQNEINKFKSPVHRYKQTQSEVGQGIPFKNKNRL